MIPLRDVIPSRTVPFVTVTLIALNLVTWIIELSLPSETLEQFLKVYGVVPAFFTWPAVLTSMFLHGDWFHLLGNMLYLWIFGDNIEDRLGHMRYLLFYLLCGTVAALAQVASSPGSEVPIIGASGAIAGVMAGYMVLYPRSRVLTLVPLFIFIELIEVPAVLFLGVWFFMQLVGEVGSIASTTQGSAIAFWAHIAGFVTGIGAVLALNRPERQRVDWWDGYASRESRD
jgi:membrane associated rhomboid family serine protease